MLNVSFVFTGYINGRPYWISTQYGMEIVWNGTYWEILNWPYDGLPINYTDTNIPITGWQLIDNTSITATFTVNLGECCFDYSYLNNISESTLIIEYLDCNYDNQAIVAEFGTSGSFCATSILYASDTGSYSTSGSLCEIPPSPSITPSISISATPSVTPSITPSVTPSISVGVSITPSVTPTITPSNTPSITPSITPSLTATPTSTPTPTPTSSPAGPTLYAISLSAGYSNSSSACFQSMSITVYSFDPVLSNGSIVYSDTNLTLFEGGGLIYYQDASQVTYQISTFGDVAFTTPCT